MFRTGVMVFVMLVTASTAYAGGEAFSSAALEALRVQVEAERNKEEELRLLQLDVERLKLEVDKKKALIELGRIAGEATDPAEVVGRTDVLPVLRYVFMSSTRKEALFDVQGKEHRVHEGMEFAGGGVKAISYDGVLIKAKDGTESVFRPEGLLSRSR